MCRLAEMFLLAVPLDAYEGTLVVSDGRVSFCAVTTATTYLSNVRCIAADQEGWIQGSYSYPGAVLAHCHGWS
jgi:hypothetical protein